MKLLTSNEMKTIENNSMKKYSIPSLLLMENAALGVVSELKKFSSKKFLVIAGKGNNGGDGLAVARHLFISGEDVSVIFIGNREKATPDCTVNLISAEKLGIPFIFLSDELTLSALSAIDNSDVIVDAIIGTGLSRDLSPFCTLLIQKINSSESYILSVDCPTGVNSDNGKICPVAVSADETVTFFRKKLGLSLYPACKYSGTVKIKGISIPEISETFASPSHNILTLAEAKELLPKRDNYAHKGAFGKVYAFTGSRDMTGAACISASSAYKIGCGLVYLCSVPEVSAAAHILLPEAVTVTLPHADGKLCKASLDGISIDKADIILTGCGIGSGSSVEEFVYKLAETVDCPLILDADALNAVSKNTDILLKLKKLSVITPHLGEMSRLTGLSISEISDNTIKTAVDFSKKYNVITILKSARTVIANPEGTVYINETGSSAMSKGGSGDCLAGIIAGLAAQGLDMYYSAVLGCCINGISAEISEEQNTAYSTLATDLIKNIPSAVSKITSHTE